MNEGVVGKGVVVKDEVVVNVGGEDGAVKDEVKMEGEE